MTGFGAGALPGLGRHLAKYRAGMREWKSAGPPKIIGRESAVRKAWATLKKPTFLNPYLLRRTLTGGVIGAMAGGILGSLIKKLKRKVRK